MRVEDAAVGPACVLNSENKEALSTEVGWKLHGGDGIETEGWILRGVDENGREWHPRMEELHGQGRGVEKHNLG